MYGFVSMSAIECDWLAPPTSLAKALRMSFPRLVNRLFCQQTQIKYNCRREGGYFLVIDTTLTDCKPNSQLYYHYEFPREDHYER